MANYTITNLLQLLAVANDLSGNYTLANNIDITTVTTWVPIGSVSTPFTGTFNGNGYTLFGPNVSSSYAAPGYHVGIFGYSSGNISNLNVAVRSISTSVMGSYYTGLLVGYNNGGAITNCRVSLDYLYSSYTVSNMGPFGVVVGCCNGGSVTDCSGSIYNQVNSGCLPIFGGIVGNLSNNGVVTRCISNSKLNFLTPAVSDVGGIVGIVTLGTVSLCCFTGTISNQPAGSSVISNAGGIAGRVISGTITNCYCNNPFNIYYTATTNSYMGGILGTGTVSTPSTITNCYTTGCVPNQLSGQIASQYANAVNCYHSGKNISIGTSVTSLELQQHSTYSGWNFGIWGLIENSTYPILYFQNGCIYWNGMGNDNNWSTPGNWNLNRLPLSNEIVFFDNYSTKNCTIDRPVEISCLNIGLNYSGTISQNQVLKINNDYVQQSGTFISNQTLIINGISYKVDGSYIVGISGDGSVGTPYLITNANQLQSIPVLGLNKYYLINNNIDMSTIPSFIPIGTRLNPFTGNLNGQNYTISNLKITSQNSNCGLFGVTSSATIKNVILSNAYISGKSGVGGIVGKSLSSTIDNCNSSGFIGGIAYVGGIIGYSAIDSVSNCNVSSTIYSADYGGAILGIGFSNVSGCIANSYVNWNSSNAGAIGGLAIGSIGTINYGSGTISNNSWVGNKNNINSDNNAVSKTTWTQRTTSGQRAWTGIACSSDGSKLAACVNGDYIYTSINYGATWTQQVTSGQRAWTGIVSSQNGVNLAASGTNTTFWTSADSGASWSQRISALVNPSNYYDVQMSNSVVYYITAEGNASASFVYTSIDSGVTFNKISINSEITPGNGTWKRVGCSGNGKIMLAGDDIIGNLWISEDYGSTWRKAAVTNNGIAWATIISTFDGQYICAATQSCIFVSIDFGRTWNNVYTSAYTLGRGCCSSDGRKLYIIENGWILASYDWGQNFIQLIQNTSKTMSAVATSGNGTLCYYSPQTDYVYYGDIKTQYTLATAGSNNIEATPILLYDAKDLDNIRLNLAGNYQLANDIDVSNVVWNPIGTQALPFTGSLDGANYTIRGLSNTTSPLIFGLFGYSSGNISNLNITLGIITLSNSATYCGGVVGYNNGGNISNCKVSMLPGIALQFLFQWGGIAGKSITGTIQGCSCNMYISALISSGNIGGIVGELISGTVTKCIHNGYIYNSVSAGSIGGIVGLLTSGTVSYCSSNTTLSMSGGSISNIGGIVGLCTTGTITQCYFNGSFQSVVGTYIGGILGGGTVGTPTTIINCYSSGLIQGASTVGGIAGRYATVTNSYHIGPDNSIGTLKTLGQLKQHSSYSNWNMGIWGLIENATTPSLYIEDNYWIGSGNWSSPANWSRGRIPSIQDIVRFDNFSINNCTIDVPVIVGGISIGANYIGTITQSQSLDVLNDFIQQNGTFLQNAPIIVRGIITKWPLIT